MGRMLPFRRIRFLVLLLLATAATASAVVPAPSGQTPAVTVLHFGHLWNGTRLLANATVVVEDGTIKSVGTGRVPIPPGAAEIDLGPYTDLHTHMTYYWNGAAGTTPLRQPRRTAAQTAELAFENARKTLETGVTTVRDLGASGGADYLMRDAINRGEKIGPRMFVAGQGITAPRTGTLTPEQLTTMVQQRVTADSDWIKLYGSTGSFDDVSTTQTMTFEQMKAVVDAAHAAGKPAAIHSYGASGVHDAVMAGADSVEHGIEVDDGTFYEMVRRGTVWVPTVDHNQYYVDAKADYAFPDDHIGPLEDYIRKNFDAMKRAFHLGVKLGMGSDAVYSDFGRNTGELRWFVKAGMTPAQALATATTTAAALLGKSSTLGRIAPGYAADLVAVSGSPLQKIDDVITGVKWVMKDGKVVVDKR